MCTAITYTTKDNYFGRNLDLDFSYNETVTICPRNYPFSFRHQGENNSHFAMIGMATVVDDYPLFYEAVNEKGLGMAGLNFPDNANYQEVAEDKVNVASFEFIPWLLSQCESVAEVKGLCKNLNITNEAFSSDFQPSPLHWLVADGHESIVLEPLAKGLKVYDNSTGVLTNNPTFDKQLFNLNNYRHLSPKVSENRFAKELELETYSRGMGGLGLPGDLSSMSRYVKVAFTKLNSVAEETEESSVNQFFHILKSVEQQKGLCYVDESGKYEYTIYSSCINTDKGIYYYTTYDNSQITAVDMHKENLDDSKLVSYPLVKEWQVNYQN
ncbi:MULTISPECIES: choloylglycine hydrolase [Streptococcus]|uniref:choloylglycine hydrolase n=1 Tax=Streptococcus TaxID=1301 RepID=UPI000E072E2B|nr:MULTISPECIES: choloylglycine hydrolase [Streptococcus]MCQ2962495.1 choloylglycine hydrolase [Streptococcus sp.]SUO79817.1 bile salt (choloylglycine) hydrolase [Streptococcus equinus]